MAAMGPVGEMRGCQSLAGGECRARSIFCPSAREAKRKFGRSILLNWAVTCVIGRDRPCELLHLQRLGTGHGAFDRRRISARRVLRAMVHCGAPRARALRACSRASVP